MSPPPAYTVEAIPHGIPIDIELLIGEDVPGRVEFPSTHGVPEQMEEHPLEVLGVVAVYNGVSGVLGIPNDHIETPVTLLTLGEYTLQKIKGAVAVLRAPQLFPFELLNLGLGQESREFACC